MAPPTAPLPESLEPLLWLGLAVWLLYVGLAARKPGSPDLAMALCWASIPVSAGVFVIPEAWPEITAGLEVRLVLWLGMGLGLSGVLMWLRHRSDAEDGGGDQDDDPPEPPWWPEFERDFRRYARRPREPVA